MLINNGVIGVAIFEIVQGHVACARHDDGQRKGIAGRRERQVNANVDISVSLYTLPQALMG